MANGTSATGASTSPSCRGSRSWARRSSCPTPISWRCYRSGPTTGATEQTHQVFHNLLRGYTGITGVDYTQFNLADPSDLCPFLSYHEAEHAQLRAALGLT